MLGVSSGEILNTSKSGLKKVFLLDILQYSSEYIPVVFKFFRKIVSKTERECTDHIYTLYLYPIDTNMPLNHAKNFVFDIIIVLIKFWQCQNSSVDQSHDMIKVYLFICYFNIKILVILVDEEKN